MAATRSTATSFVALCKTEKVRIPPNTAAYQTLLAQAGHADPSVLRTNPAWKERAAALAWAQSSLALAEDPLRLCSPCAPQQQIDQVGFF